MLKIAETHHIGHGCAASSLDANLRYEAHAGYARVWMEFYDWCQTGRSGA